LIFLIKILFFAFLFIIVRARYPRLRYDLLIFLTWKVFLPIALSSLTLIFLISYFCF
jgi:NADH-quinone oxidoreductase subunit H